MHKNDVQLLATLLKERSGLALAADKKYLIENRLLPLARRYQLHDISQLCAKIRTEPTEELLVEITEAMTTSESSFFRDSVPYEQLRQTLLPKLMQAPSSKKHIRIWSAACATGQEPYSIAMCLQEDKNEMKGWHCDITATDISQKVIDKAQQGIFSQFEAQRGLSIHLLIKYFSLLPDTSWHIKKNIRSMVQFKQHNLLDDYAVLGTFDIIFCRNVLIYFDDATKVRITKKLAHSLAPDGTLILGVTETLKDPEARFTALAGFRGAYKLNS